MKFESDVESLTVLVGKGKYCKFINGIYETEAPDEIAALLRAKGVKRLNEDSVIAHDDQTKVAKKAGFTVGKTGKSRKKRRR